MKKWVKNLDLVEEGHQSINFGPPTLKKPPLKRKRQRPFKQQETIYELQ
jgi:hypothetical protein